MEPIPDAFLPLFETKTIGILTTLLPDGSPHSTPVWIDYDGEYVLVNTAEGRRKERNTRNDPRVSLCVYDPASPYRYITIRGVVAEITTDDAMEHANKLAQRYLDLDEYPSHGKEHGARVLLRIEPVSVHASTRKQRKAEREK